MLPPQTSFYTPGQRLPYNNSYIYINQCYVQRYSPCLPTSTSTTFSPSPVSDPQSSLGAPILFLHGGGLTGALWDATPDGRPSWAHRAAALGHPVYVLDAVDSGRSERAPDHIRQGSVEHRTAREVWTRFRLGPDTDEAFEKKMGWEDGIGQFGLIGSKDEGHVRGKERSNAGGEEGARHREIWFENLIRSQSARRRTTAVVEAKGIRDAVKMLGKCWIVAHSNGAALALLALQMDEASEEKAKDRKSTAHANTEAVAHASSDGVRIYDLVEKMVLVEPPPQADQTPWTRRTESLKPLIVWGDYLKGHNIWERVLKGYMEHGMTENWILPERGIRGNSHFPMCDRNSDVVWDEIYSWLAVGQVAKAT